MQALIYPVTDAGCNTASYGEFGEGHGLTAASMQRFWNLYLDGADGLDPDASPLRADDLAGSPPAFVLTAGFDPLRDEGEAYCEALRDAGVEAELQPLRRRDPRLLALAGGHEALAHARSTRSRARCAPGSPERNRRIGDFGRSGQPARRYGARHGCHTDHRHVPLLAPVRRHGGRLPARAADRARGGGVGLRRRRPPLSRRHREPLVRQHRPRQPRGRRRASPSRCAASRPTRPSATSATGPANELVRAPRLARADGRRADLPHLRRRRLDRRGGQDRPPPLDPAGPARARAPDQPHAGLPRHARLRHEHRRHRGQHEQLGPAGPRRLRRRATTRCPRWRRRSSASGPSTWPPSSASR